MDLSRFKEYEKSKWYVRIPLFAIPCTLIYLMVIHRTFNLLEIPIDDFYFQFVKWVIWAFTMDLFFFYNKNQKTKPKNEV